MAKPPPRFAKADVLQFEHPVQHTIEAFDRLPAQVRQPQITPREALLLAEEMLSHGHPDVLLLTGLLRQNPHRDAVRRGIVLETCLERLRQQLHVEALDRKLLVRAYRRDGYLLFESPQKSRKLLVFFTTIFNNFYLSHLNLQALLKDLGCHILILKETTLAHYQRGVASFATDIPGIAEKIGATARQLGADRVYVSGFSSGGYAALQTSLMLPNCQGYLGFSHPTDLTPGSSLPRPWYLTEEVQAQLDPRWLGNLRIPLQQADPAVPRFLCYGDRAAKDVLHAANLAGLPTIRLVRLARATHNSIQYLLEKGRLTEAFSQLVADR
jgi:hypothetical protein